MAKLKAECIMMGVGDNSYIDKTTKAKVVAHQAQMFFTEDSSMMSLGIDRKNPTLLAMLQGMKMVDGVATIAIREFKGSKFLDLVGFDKRK